MDKRTWIGTLAECKVLAKLVEKQLHVFSQTSGKAPFDLVVLVNGQLLRVSVKGTQTKNNFGNWEVQLRSIRSNRTQNTVHLYENNSCDILAVYVEPIDQVYFFLSKEITQSTALTITPDRISKATLDFVLESWQNGIAPALKAEITER